MARSSNLGYRWPVSQNPVCSRPSFFFFLSRPAPAATTQWPLHQGGRPQWPFNQGWRSLMAILSRPMAVIKAASLNHRFNKDLRQKRPNGQIFKFGLQMASFTESRIKNLSAAGRAIFYQRQPQRPLCQGGQPQWPFYQGRL